MAISEKNDRQAPDRVFIAWPNDNGCGLAFTVPSKAGQTRTEFVRADLAAPSAQSVDDDWREIEQGHQPRLTDGYTAVRASKPGFWFVKGAGPAIAHDAPSAPAEVEGLVERAGTAFADYFRRNYPGPDTIISNPDWHAPRLFAAATREMATALTHAQATIARLTAERDQARAEAAAAYDRAAKVAHNRESHAKGETARACRGIAVSIRALATEPGTTALAEMLDAETRACAEICDRNDQVGGWVSRDTILTRIDQRKEAGA